jgi:hypothetical protein
LRDDGERVKIEGGGEIEAEAAMIRVLYPLVICISLCGSVYGQGNPPQAPVGHRQPTHSSVAQEPEPEQTPTDKKH